MKEWVGTYSETSFAAGRAILMECQPNMSYEGNLGPLLSVSAHLIPQGTDNLVVGVRDGERANKRGSRWHCTMQIPLP